MVTILAILLGVTLLAVLGVLLAGVVGMGGGGGFNSKYGNKLMRARVMLQGLAIALMIALSIAVNA
jgi:hypothetical protein